MRKRARRGSADEAARWLITGYGRELPQFLENSTIEHAHILLYEYMRPNHKIPFHSMDGSVHHKGTTYLPGNGYQYIGESNEAFKRRLEDEDP